MLPSKSAKTGKGRPCLMELAVDVAPARYRQPDRQGSRAPIVAAFFCCFGFAAYAVLCSLLLIERGEPASVMTVT